MKRIIKIVSIAFGAIVGVIFLAFAVLCTYLELLDDKGQFDGFYEMQ